MSVYVFGHKNPDSDTICSAIALADLKSKLGVACTATAQGELAPETKFILDKFGVAAPAVKTSYAGEKVFLVDTSDLTQLPEDIKQAEVLGIVDHHKLGDLTTSSPLECWIWPVGCTATVLTSMYKFGSKSPRTSPASCCAPS
jgi:Inorganic pyrophosphatase/exopolyphosphatase